ncbi:MAG: hypothetical protein LCH84_07605 [Gemmatimonadetes bacterium]|nr:hypothetical protein [Gemmatimonadota bacterium]
MRRTVFTIALAVAPLALAACTPYGVHTSARPLVAGERSSALMMIVVPRGLELDDSTGMAVPSFDYEQRVGLDDRSDVGFRLNSASGAIVTYKRRLDAPSSSPSAATALMVGGGVVNWASHAHFEATLLHSRSDTGTVTPYGGLRLIQIAPLNSRAVHDHPTVGLFGGTRFGGRSGGVAVELGVFYDRSALGMRRGDLVVVPSVSLQRGPRRSRPR